MVSHHGERRVLGRPPVLLRGPATTIPRDEQYSMMSQTHNRPPLISFLQERGGGGGGGVVAEGRAGGGGCGGLRCVTRKPCGSWGGGESSSDGDWRGVVVMWAGVCVSRAVKRGGWWIGRGER